VPSGIVRTTAHRPRVVVEEADVVACWADENLTMLDAEQVAKVVRRIDLAALNRRVKIVEVIDEANLLLADGELVHWYGLAGDDSSECPGIGDAYPADGPDGQLVARVDILAAHLEAHDSRGGRVPGVIIEPGSVSASVQAEKP